MRQVQLLVLTFLIACPLIVSADFEVPPSPTDTPSDFELSFLFNDLESDATISSSTPSVDFFVSASSEVYFTRLYICEQNTTCNGSSYTKRFDINATSTSFSKTWDGVSSGSETVGGTFDVLVRYYRYDVSEEAEETYAPFKVLVNNVSNDDTNSESDIDEDSPSDTNEEDPTEEEMAESLGVGFSLNGLSEHVVSTTSPRAVFVSATTTRDVYVTRMYICLEENECNGSSYTKRFDINATTTAVSVEWDGVGKDGEDAPLGTYTIVLRYYDYDVSEEAVEMASPYQIVLEEIVPPYILITPETHPSNKNVGHVVFKKDEGPYLVDGNIYIRYGRITIEPGAVIKFTPGSTLSVHASAPVSAVGTKEDPIYFTSFKDDTVGGDTNEDGDSSVPTPGDWGYVSFGTGSTNRKLSFEYVRVRYGGEKENSVGYPSLVIYYPWYNARPGVGYELKNIEVTNSAGAGALLFIGRNHSLSITNSSFAENATYGVQKIMLFGSPKNSDQTGSLILDGNWWGTPTGPQHETLNPNGEGNGITGTKLSLQTWLSHDPFSPPPNEPNVPDSPDPEPEPETKPTYQECCSSVIFIPGFQGSILKSGNNTLWPPTLGNVGGDLKKLVFKDGESVTENVTVHGLVNTFYTKSIYEDFTNFLDELATSDTESGTSTIKTWKPFAYDWRYGPDEIVDINDWVVDIEQLAEDSFTGKVTLVTHSYGGLVGKALIKRLQDKGKADLVDSFVMVGTPQLGTPQTVTALLHGDGAEVKKNIEVELFSFSTSFDVVLVTKKDARNLGLTLDGAYHLLPSAEYFNHVVDPVVIFNPGLPGGLVSKWYSSYDHNGITTYSDAFDFLRAERVPRTKNPAVLDSSLLTKAYDWHETYDTFKYPSGMRVVQIAGWGLPTIKGIEYLGDKKGTSNILMTTEGDKTVVYPSAVASDEEIYYFNLESFDVFEGYADHIDILNAFPIQYFLKQLVTLSSTESISYLTTDKPTPSNENDKLIVSAHSPVTLGVTDQFGNYTGITPGQDPDADLLTIETGIPGSSYFTVGDSKYIVLPDDGEYTFVMGGTGEGEVTVIIETLSDGDKQTTNATYNFSVSESSEATLTIQNGTSSEVAVDQDGDGVVDESILSDEALEEQKQEQEQQEENENVGESSESSIVTTSVGGGGPLQQNNPVVTPQTDIKVDDMSASTPVSEEVLPIVPEEESVSPVFSNRVVEEPLPEEVESQPAKEVISTKTNQQASVVQSGWYDDFVGFTKRLLNSVVSYLASFF